MSDFLSKALRYGLLAVLATPLVFGTRLLFPFIVYRTYFLYFLVDALFVLFVYQYGFSWLTLFRRARVFSWLGIFFLIKIITDLFGFHPAVSFLGNYERMMGFITWLHLLLWLIMIVTVFASRAEYHKVEQAVALTSALVSLYGLLQYWQIAFAIRSVDDRLFSTIGNPGFLAGFLLLAISFCFICLRRAPRPQRWLYVTALGLDLIALYLSATRGAIIGFLIGSFLLLLWLCFYPPQKWQGHKTRLRWLAGVVVLSFLFAVAATYTSNQTGTRYQSVTLRRLSEISLSEVNIRSRLFLWSTAIRAEKDHLFFGVGENNLATIIDRAYDTRIIEQWFDSTHNQFLDIWLAHGALGLIVYITLLVVVVRAFFSARHVDTFDAGIYLAALAAYIFYSLFLFDTLVVALPLFILFGASAVVQAPQPRRAPAASNNLLATTVAGMVALALFFGYALGIQVLALTSDAYHRIGNTTDLSYSLTEFTRAHQLAYFGYGNLAAIIRDASIAAIHKSGTTPATQLNQLFSIMADSYRVAREKEGVNSQWLADPGKVYLEISSSTNPYLDTSAALFDQALALSPGRLDLWYAKAQVSIQKHVSKEAEKILVQAEQIFPQNTADIEFRLAEVAAGFGSAADALTHLDGYIKTGKKLGVAGYDHFVQVFISRHAWSDALLVIKRQLELAPNNPKFLANLAQVYKQLGDRVNARSTAVHLQSLYPAMAPQVQSFIDSL